MSARVSRPSFSEGQPASSTSVSSERNPLINHKNTNITPQNTPWSTLSVVTTYTAQVATKIHDALFSNSSHALLLLLPFAIASRPAGWPDLLRFGLSLAVIPPLRSISTMVTEAVAARLGEILGGLAYTLLDSTMTFLVSFVMLYHSKIRLLQSFILGSIFCNIVVGPGCCFFAGGLTYQTQTYDKMIIAELYVWLVLSTSTMFFPTVVCAIETSLGKETSIIDPTSRAAAIVLMVFWLFSLLFQLKTHHNFLKDSESGDEVEDEETEEFEEPFSVHPILALAFGAGTVLLALIPVNNVIDTANKVAAALHCSEEFIGFFVLPLVLNGSDLSLEMSIAYDGSLRLALPFCLVAAIQYPLLVVPVMVFAGWISGSKIDLDFGILQTVTTIIALAVGAFVLNSGQSNYFQGILYLGLFVIVATTFALLPDDVHIGSVPI